MDQGGYRCVGYCEIDGHVRKSYQSIFDKKQQVEMHDITKLSDEFIQGIKGFSDTI